MEVLPYVLGWAIPAVLSAICGYLVGLLKKARKDAADAREIQEFILLTVCRIAIYDEHFSIDEKVDTYRVYRKHGGNHQAKKHMSDLLGEDADAYLARHE